MVPGTAEAGAEAERRAGVGVERDHVLTRGVEVEGDGALGDAVAAFGRMAAGAQSGKIVIEVGNG